MGKVLIMVGLVCIVIGLIILYIPRTTFLGRLPGDIRIEKEGFKLYFPIMTSLLASIILSLVLYFINRWKS